MSEVVQIIPNPHPRQKKKKELMIIFPFFLAHVFSYVFGGICPTTVSLVQYLTSQRCQI